MNWVTRRAGEGLSTISRIGIDATFKVSKLIFKFYVKGHLSVILLLSLPIKVTPGNFAQLLILHAHIGGSIVILIIFSVGIIQTLFGLHSSIASCLGGLRRSTPRPLSWSTLPAPPGQPTWTWWWTLRCKNYQNYDRAYPRLWTSLLMFVFFFSGMRNAWSVLHPDHNIRGCLFHFSQVWTSKMSCF